MTKEIKEKLIEQKKSLEKQLESFAKKNENIKDDWNTKFPKFNEGANQQSEELADEVEEYATLLPIEHDLELKLRDINLALKKIKNKTYGKCEECKKSISKERLKIYPEARLCKSCKK